MKTIIQWEDIQTNKTSGTVKVKCPNCIDTRTNKRDKSLSVNLDKGVAKCHYCEAVSFEKRQDYQKESYELPPQEWQNYTKLSDKLVKWFSEERGIRQSTLMDLKISEEQFYQPAHNKQVNNIVFNYFERGELVNKKYRSGSKKFTQTKGGKPIMYNIDSIIGEEEVFIVEGEMDVLAMYEAGYKNVISIPNGANDSDDYWKNSLDYLSDVKLFIIGTDKDDKGETVREKIAHRLGKWRCEFIEWNGKDANDDLKSGDIHKSIKERKRFPVTGVYTVEDLFQSMLDLKDKGLPETIKPKHNSFNKVNEVFSILKGQLTVITGIPSHGKSNYLEWYLLNLVNDYELKASLYSPEHRPMELHHAVLFKKATGKNFWSATKSDIQRYKEWANEKIYFTDTTIGSTPNWTWLIDSFKEQVLSYGINMFVVDAFNKVEFDNDNGSDLQQIRKVLTKLTNFCIQYEVNVFLVAHPTKMKKKEDGTYEAPTLYDVSGSADFRNQTHNGFGIHRTFPTNDDVGYTTFTNLKTKLDFQGKIGDSALMYYDIETSRYYCQGTQKPTFDMTEIEQNQLTPNLEFESDNGWKYEKPDDLPF